MPVCKECGFTASRLQWTHFKYNCTGKFKNGTEYKKHHHDAILVDPELAARTSITLANLILKYGDTDGARRWEEYKQKQSTSNSLEYKAKKYGWNKEQFDEFNRGRASTVENFINKHGEKIGMLKWDEYCERQKYTNSIEYFCQKYGGKGEIKWNEYCVARGNSSNIQFIMQKYAVDQAGAERIFADRYNHASKFTSKAEKIFVQDFISFVGPIKYSYVDKQFCIWSKQLNAPVFYDVTCTEKMKIVEFNGDYWHCNPTKYQADFVIKQSGAAARDVWARDKIKTEEAMDRGFDVLQIWESEYNDDPTKIMERIKQWWIK